MQHVENTISLPIIGSCSPCQPMSNSLLFQYDTNINIERNVQSYLSDAVPTRILNQYNSMTLILSSYIMLLGFFHKIQS